MNDMLINLIIILILASAVGITLWRFAIHLQTTTGTMATDVAKVVKNSLGFTPQVKIEQRIVYQQTREILELALIEREFDVESDYTHKRMGSEKKISLRGFYRVKIGFDLQKGFNIDVVRDGFLKPVEARVSLPHAEILSIEQLDIRRDESGGLINWVSNKDRDEASRKLSVVARDKASKMELLDEAERQIENRLSEFLLPKIERYSITFGETEEKVKLDQEDVLSLTG